MQLSLAIHHSILIKSEISNSLYLNSKISLERSIDHCVIVKRVRTKKIMFNNVNYRNL